MRTVKTNIDGLVRMWTSFNVADFGFGYTPDMKKEENFLKIVLHGQESSVTTSIETDKIKRWIEFLKKRKDTDDFVTSSYRRVVYVFDRVKGKDEIRFGMWDNCRHTVDITFSMPEKNFKSFVAIMENALNKESTPE